jgi:tetratricopeptide (TPR) repeat protein
LWWVLLGVVLLALGVYASQGWSAYRQGQLKRMSRVELERLTLRQPQNLEARYRLGVAYAQEGRYPEAVREFLTVLEKEPARAETLNDLGVTYLLQERYYEALVSFQGALQLKPDFAAAYANMGRLHLATKMPFTATKELQKASELDSANVDVLCDLGEAFQQTLNFKSAVESYRRAIQINPRHVTAQIGLGRAYYSLGQMGEAEKAIQTALQQDPDAPLALLALARMRLDKPGSAEAEVNEARRLVERLLKADPHNPDAWQDLGRIALRQNKPAEAVEHLKKALAGAPQSNAVLHQLERALRLAGRTADADRTAKVMRERSLRDREETRLEEHISHHPEDWNAQAELGHIYAQSGKRGLALLITRRIQQAAPQHPALPELQRAVSQMPTAPRPKPQ